MTRVSKTHTHALARAGTHACTVARAAKNNEIAVKCCNDKERRKSDTQ